MSFRASALGGLLRSHAVVIALLLQLWHGVPGVGASGTAEKARPAVGRIGTAGAVALLRRGERAERVVAYSGVKVIRAERRCSERGGSAAAPYERVVRIWHGGPGKNRIEFIRADGEAAPVVVENGGSCWRYSPQHHVWRPISWRPPEPRLDLLLKNYRVLPAGVGRIAGRRVLKIRIEPRHPGNPRKQSWLDLATAIALRSELYDSSGRLVSRTEFRSFRPEKRLPASLFHVSAVAGCAPNEAETDGRLTFAVALPRYLPRGYVLERVTRSRSNGVEVARARFTDGLNTLSLTQWRGGQDPEDRGSEQFWGPGEQLRWRIGPVSALLTGDLRAAELRRIAHSIRPPPVSAQAWITQK